MKAVATRSSMANLMISLGMSAGLADNAIRIAAILGFTLATAAAAQIRVPMPGTIVPATLQTAIVLLAGLRLGRKDGAISQALYVAGGATGLPFFAGAGGFAALLGPTGGYLLGFVLAAWIAGDLNRDFGGSYLRTWLIAFLASVALFVPGVIQLKLETMVSWPQAFLIGVVPFILGDFVKVTFAATAYSLYPRRRT